jgi:hypothetical protein
MSIKAICSQPNWNGVDNKIPKNRDSLIWHVGF